MLKSHAIVVGKSYVNERTAQVREVIEEVDDRRVKYNAFDLNTGKLIPAPYQICHKSQLSRWADREARPREISRFHPYVPGPWFEEASTRETVDVQLERTKANMEQLAGTHPFHKW